jgi:hypothetical protein
MLQPLAKLPQLIDSHRRAGVALVVLFSLGAGIVGVPIFRCPRKDSSQPFPCQNCPCGCLDAEQCWRSCCCQTNAQKLAWARAHHVTPPEYVVAAACREARGGQPSAPLAAAACCSRPHLRAPPEGCCRGARPSRRLSAMSSTFSAAPRGQVGWVLLEARNRCRGVSSFWLLLSQVAVPVARVWMPAKPVCVDHCVSRTTHLVSVCFPPPVPPPKHVAVSCLNSV